MTAHLTGFATDDEVRAARILYASLDEQEGRRLSVARNIAGRVPYAFSRCVDGRGWGDAETDAILAPEMQARRRAALKMGRNFLPSGAIACAATHRSNLIGRIEGRGKILCEDDAVLTEQAIAALQDDALVDALDRLDGVTLLNYRSRGDIIAERDPVARVGPFTVHRVQPKGVGSAACYFVPAQVAPQIVALQTPIRVPVDNWNNMIEAGAFANLYVVHPAAAGVGDFPTTINYAVSPENPVIAVICRVKLLRRIRRRLRSSLGAFNEHVTKWAE